MQFCQARYELEFKPCKRSIEEDLETGQKGVKKEKKKLEQSHPPFFNNHIQAPELCCVYWYDFEFQPTHSVHNRMTIYNPLGSSNLPNAGPGEFILTDY